MTRRGGGRGAVDGAWQHVGAALFSRVAGACI